MKCLTRKNASGYLEIYTRGRWQLLHRVAATNKLGRAIRPGHEIHHRDGNKCNNRHSNLEELPRGVHRALHARQRRKIRR